jgi:glycosidase
MRTFRAALAACLVLAACQPAAERTESAMTPMMAPDTSWVARSAIYQVFVRDFSPEGNFRGVIAGLDRIQQAGADVIWLMPIHPIGTANRKGTLGSPYAATDYRAINPDFGTADDFRALVDSAHARGLKVIIDFVPDHTAPDAPWVREHPDWYFRDSAGAPMVPRDAEGKLTDWTDVVQLDYGNSAVRREVTAIMRWWLQEFGIDGFRVDVAGFVPNGFWREATPQLRAAVPRPIMLLAEWGTYDMHTAGFDLTYGWAGYGAIKAVWKGESPASALVQLALAEQDSMPRGGMRLRFTTNHDETAWDNPPVTIFRGAAGARAAFVAMALLPGRPMVYNGQEVESPQKLRLFEHDPIAWDQPDATAAREHYARILRLARTHPAFLRGALRAVETSAPDDVIAYARDSVVVLVNARQREVRFTVSGFDVGGAHNLLTDRTQQGATVTLPPYGALVLERQVH